MAAVISDAPSAYAPAHDDIWFTLTSNQSGTTNFKFIVDIKVNNTLVSRAKVFPDASGYGYYNSGPVVRAYITNYFEPSGSSILVASNDKLHVDYKLELGEEVSGVVTTNQASGNFAGYNCYRSMFTDYYKTGATTFTSYYDDNTLTNYEDNWLTERDLTISADVNESMFITFFKKTAGTYTGVLQIVGEGEVVQSSVSGTIALNEMNLFNLGSANINTWAASAVINSNTYGYNFYLDRAGTQSRTVKIRNKCYPKHQPYNIHFLNRLGGYDTMKFALVNKRSSSFERQTFQKPQWQSQNNIKVMADSFNRINETNVAFSVNHKNRMHLVSDWVSQQESDWMQQLIASTSVYLESNGGYFPVIISNSQYDFKIVSADKLWNVEIDIDISRTINSQFR